MLFEEENLSVNDVIYFEHDSASVESAQSVGIIAHHYNEHTKDLVALKKFLDENVASE